MVHNHSKAALIDISESGVKSKRRNQIVAVFLKNYNTPLTDFEVLAELFPGSDNMNRVSPRLTELHKERILMEVEPGKTPSGRKCRRSKLVHYDHQLSMF